jgi:Zn-dependent protease
MIPLSPFDGGRITGVLSPRIWFAGVPVLVGVFVVRPSPLLIVMAILAIPQLQRAWRYDASLPENMRYYGIAPEVKLTYAFYYLALLVFLALMTFGVHDMLGSARASMH